MNSRRNTAKPLSTGIAKHDPSWLKRGEAIVGGPGTASASKGAAQVRWGKSKGEVRKKPFSAGQKVSQQHTLQPDTRSRACDTTPNMEAGDINPQPNDGNPNDGNPHSLAPHPNEGNHQQLPRDLTHTITPERRAALDRRRQRETTQARSRQKLDRVHQFGVCVFALTNFLFAALLYTKVTAAASSTVLGSLTPAYEGYGAIFAPLFVHDLYMTITYAYRAWVSWGKWHVAPRYLAVVLKYAFGNVPSRILLISLLESVEAGFLLAGEQPGAKGITPAPGSGGESESDAPHPASLMLALAPFFATRLVSAVVRAACPQDPDHPPQQNLRLKKIVASTAIIAANSLLPLSIALRYDGVTDSPWPVVLAPLWIMIATAAIIGLFCPACTVALLCSFAMDRQRAASVINFRRWLFVFLLVLTIIIYGYCAGFMALGIMLVKRLDPAALAAATRAAADAAVHRHNSSSISSSSTSSSSSSTGHHSHGSTATWHSTGKFGGGGAADQLLSPSSAFFTPRPTVGDVVLPLLVTFTVGLVLVPVSVLTARGLSRAQERMQQDHHRGRRGQEGIINGVGEAGEDGDEGDVFLETISAPLTLLRQSSTFFREYHGDTTSEMQPVGTSEAEADAADEDEDKAAAAAAGLKKKRSPPGAGSSKASTATSTAISSSSGGSSSSKSFARRGRKIGTSFDATSDSNADGGGSESKSARATSVRIKELGGKAASGSGGALLPPDGVVINVREATREVEFDAHQGSVVGGSGGAEEEDGERKECNEGGEVDAQLAAAMEAEECGQGQDTSLAGHPRTPSFTERVCGGDGDGDGDQDRGTQSRADHGVDKQVLDIRSDGVDDGDTMDEICVICMDVPRDSVLIPCGHGAQCFECAKDVARKSGALCPICRDEFTDFYRLGVSTNSSGNVVHTSEGIHVGRRSRGESLSETA